MNKKENIIKDIINRLKAGEDQPFYVYNLDDLLEYGETLNGLAKNLLEADKGNSLAESLKETLGGALSDLYSAQEKREEMEDIQDDLNDAPEMADDARDEKEDDRELAEGDAQSIIDDAAVSYEESLKQAALLEAEYRKENYPVI